MEGKKVSVYFNNKTEEIKGKNIIIATGARSRELPSMPQDGKKILGYREAMTLKNQPKDIVIVGSGAIGVEFAYFYNAMGTDLIIQEYLHRKLPLEDKQNTKQLQTSNKNRRNKIKTHMQICS